VKRVRGQSTAFLHTRRKITNRISQTFIQDRNNSTKPAAQAPALTAAMHALRNSYASAAKQSFMTSHSNQETAHPPHQVLLRVAMLVARRGLLVGFVQLLVEGLYLMLLRGYLVLQHLGQNSGLQLTSQTGINALPCERTLSPPPTHRLFLVSKAGGGRALAICCFKTRMKPSCSTSQVPDERNNSECPFFSFRRSLLNIPRRIFKRNMAARRKMVTCIRVFLRKMLGTRCGSVRTRFL